jgi:hypothetical protein
MEDISLQNSHLCLNAQILALIANTIIVTLEMKGLPWRILKETPVKSLSLSNQTCLAVILLGKIIFRLFKSFTEKKYIQLTHYSKNYAGVFLYSAFTLRWATEVIHLRPSSFTPCSLSTTNTNIKKIKEAKITFQSHDGSHFGLKTPIGVLEISRLLRENPQMEASQSQPLVGPFSLF